MWSCSDEEWQYGTVTKPVCEVVSGLGRVYNRWLSASCSYGYTSLAPPDDTACGAATFNSSCIWVAAAAPTKPSDTSCGAATLDSSCAWVAASAPTQPDDTACGAATLDSSCAWMAASPPSEPNCPPGQVTDFKADQCQWSCIIGPEACESNPPTSIAACTETIPAAPGITTIFEFQFHDPASPAPGVAPVSTLGWYLYRVSTLPGFGGDFAERLLCKPCP